MAVSLAKANHNAVTELFWRGQVAEPRFSSLKSSAHEPLTGSVHCALPART